MVLAPFVLKRHFSDLSSFKDTKLRDTPELAKQLPQASKGLWGWYHTKYIKSGSVAPLFHLIAILGIFGYSLHYSHIKHERDEKATHDQSSTRKSKK
jgi:hypothetical protein